MKKKGLVYSALIAVLFFGNVQTASANPLAAKAVEIVGAAVLDAASHVIGKIVGDIVAWADGSRENAQQAELETGLDFDNDGDVNGDGYNPDDGQQQQ